VRASEPTNHQSHVRGVQPMAKLILISAFVCLIAGCGSPRTVTVVPGTRLTATTPSEPSAQTAPTFTMALQNPATVQAPPPCEGCIGEAYDNAVSLPVQLTSSGFIGQVSLTVSGLPSTVFMPQSLAPVPLDLGDAPAGQVVSLQLYVLPGAAPGSYPFKVVATPLPGANSIAPVSLPVTLTITSAVNAAWRAE
jgi:hypothetical protein